MFLEENINKGNLTFHEREWLYNIKPTDAHVARGS